MSKDREELYRFVQNETNFMLLTQSEFKGNTYYDIRKYFINDKGQEIATKKGLMLSQDEWLKVIAILQEFFGDTKDTDWDTSLENSKPETVENSVPDVSVFDFNALDNIVIDDNFNPFESSDDMPFF